MLILVLLFISLIGSTPAIAHSSIDEPNASRQSCLESLKGNRNLRILSLESFLSELRSASAPKRFRPVFVALNTGLGIAYDFNDFLDKSAKDLSQAPIAMGSFTESQLQGIRQKIFDREVTWTLLSHRIVTTNVIEGAASEVSPVILFADPLSKPLSVVLPLPRSQDLEETVRKLIRFEDLFTANRVPDWEQGWVHQLRRKLEVTPKLLALARTLFSPSDLRVWKLQLANRTGLTRLIDLILGADSKDASLKDVLSVLEKNTDPLSREWTLQSKISLFQPAREGILQQLISTTKIAPQFWSDFKKLENRKVISEKLTHSILAIHKHIPITKTVYFKRQAILDLAIRLQAKEIHILLSRLPGEEIALLSVFEGRDTSENDLLAALNRLNDGLDD